MSTRVWWWCCLTERSSCSFCLFELNICAIKSKNKSKEKVKNIVNLLMILMKCNSTSVLINELIGKINQNNRFISRWLVKFVYLPAYLVDILVFWKRNKMSTSSINMYTAIKYDLKLQTIADIVIIYNQYLYIIIDRFICEILKRISINFNDEYSSNVHLSTFIYISWLNIIS